ncbi:hypothetical protein FIE12Z_6918 [Fusarium flagelliforme]|uniref:Uncharacterized protein n=1 Tax=Fusarium flagelliforme TaxID=2675880 RepID=A0A395MN90_9HYPO|nr:hypothetical protein FIE12Z_6918 [Fusarium flagelliforme]
MLVTSTLLTLHVTNLHWSPSQPNIKEMAVLQFSAKTQKSLILISLTDVLLHRIRYGLFAENWSPAVNPTGKRFFNAINAAMIFLFSLLGLAAGSSAAIDCYDPSVRLVAALNFPYRLPDHRRFVERDPYTIKVESQHIPTDEGCPLVNNQTCLNQDLSAILQIIRTLDPSESCFEVNGTAYFAASEG